MTFFKDLPWKQTLAAVAGLVLAAFLLNREHKLRVNAERSSEAAMLTLKGQIVAHDETRRELQGSIDELLAQNEDLRSAYAAARATAPGAKPSGAARLDTGPVKVLPAPEEPAGPPPLPPCDRKYVPDGRGGFYCLGADEDSTPATAPPQPAACVLSANDSGSFKVDEIVLQTNQINFLLVGTAEFWRESPAPRAKLASGKFSSVLSDTSVLAPPAVPRWGAEGAALCTRNGCGLGAGVLFPPATVLGLRLEGRIDALLGPTPAALGALGVRF